MRVITYSEQEKQLAGMFFVTIVRYYREEGLPEREVTPKDVQEVREEMERDLLLHWLATGKVAPDADNQYLAVDGPEIHIREWDRFCSTCREVRAEFQAAMERCEAKQVGA